jgi:type IV secretory pathway VirB2 component (pilin)
MSHHPARIRQARRDRALRLAAVAVLIALFTTAPGRSAGHETEALETLLMSLDGKVVAIP